MFKLYTKFNLNFKNLTKNKVKNLPDESIKNLNFFIVFFESI